MPESYSFLQKLPNLLHKRKVLRSLRFIPKYFIVLPLLLTSPVHSQSTYLPADDVVVEIKKLEIRKTKHRENAATLDRFSPDNKSIWGRITVEYILAKDKSEKSGVYKRQEETWIDSCILSWSVVLGRNLDGKKIPVEKHSILMTKDLVFANLEVGSRLKHFSSVYIEPSLLKRFGEAIVRDGLFVQLIIKQGDKVLATAWARGDEFVQGEKIPIGFFPEISNGSWFDSVKLQKLGYGLMSRLDTPWAWSSYDSYDFIINK